MFHDLRILARPMLLVAALAASVVPAAGASIDDEFSVAMRLYHEDHYAAAYSRLAELADAGHAESARIALLMLRHGPGLYASQWSAPRERVQRWLDLATARGRVVVPEGRD